MGKNKKRKKSRTRDEQRPEPAAPVTEEGRDANPLLTAQRAFLASLPARARTHFFSAAHVAPRERAEIWEDQAGVGEALVNEHAWATPDPRLLGVFRHFGPIVEVGCGANAYWSRWMYAEGGVDVVALDASLDDGGKTSGAEEKKRHKKGKVGASDGGAKAGGGALVIRRGGPETLSEDEEIRDSGRTLFLCYPDEDDFQPESRDEGKDAPPMSMAAACLEHFTGSAIIHVGEVYGDTLSLDQAPFGRSSSSEFQQRLAAEYHCILKMKLEGNWLHVRDTLSVWKRSETICMAFEDDEEEGNGGEADEVFHKHISPEELLPADLAAPCVAHLLGRGDGRIDKECTEIQESKRDSSALEVSAKEPDTKREVWGAGGKKKKKTKISKALVEEEDGEIGEEIVPGKVW